jgi:hypothetical protein
MPNIFEVALRKNYCENCFQKKFCPKSMELRPGCFITILSVIETYKIIEGY